ncbi:ABC transporter ATP-binding protein [Rhizobium sp. P44RR-XXIV]|uniref:ABC transporter ATP-binding protein n=1 Tax=Rhizobium sp. P44RR-XXIV TaxID=1921145 RepID=UPI000987253E|nr:ABC transporter ATP-binding protein [Rhizobium sp. P44RR-XXIV]TIX87453.1 ABC transporter ATP-binding protein [Rhizobium sp. P44RR-XXIV]
MTDLIVQNVHKYLGGLHILQGASFTANRGSIVSLLGASGSGKTTLLRCIAGLEQPEIGQVKIAGAVVFDGEKRVTVAPENRNIGLVFQSYALWPHRTVAENVAYGLKLRGVNKADAEKRVLETLGKIGLGHLAERYPDQLSGGQQQRVAICRALVYEPKILLMDEPLSNLDAKLREEARYWIRKLVLDLGICGVLVTHDQAEALAASDNILLLRNGKVEQEGPPQDIYSKPTSFYVADFLGANNVASGRITRDGAVASIRGSNWQLDGVMMGEGAQSDGKAVIRVEQIIVHDQPASGRIEMQLEACLFLGDRWEYRLSYGEFKAKAFGPRFVAAGTVWAEIPRESVWLYPEAA